jgi:hypothetical protein
VNSLRLAGLVLLAVLVVAAPVHAADSSAGTSLLRTIPEPGVVSARAVGNLLYVSALSGVSIYDVSDPRAPRRIGRLALPNAQNEDVDVGNGIMLISDDPYGGRGVLHVVDVSDPRRPRVLSRYSTWTRGLFSDSIPDITPARRGGIGHTATCILDCRYAWLAGSAKGIEVVDLRDPRRPRFAGVVPVRAAAGDWGTHDAQVDASGLAWVAGAGGTAAYDVTTPADPRLIMRTNRRGEVSPWNDLIHHNSLRVSDRTLLVTEEDLRGGCGGAGSFQTWELTPGRPARPLDRFEVERDRRAALACSAHYFDHRDGLVAAGFYEQGVRFLDVSEPGRIRQVGYYVGAQAMVWGALFAPTDPTGEVVYVLDQAKGIDVIEVERSALAPVRRPPGLERGRAALDVAGSVSDQLEVARPGQRIRIQVAAGVLSGLGARDVRVELQLPPQVQPLRLPRGARFERRTRRVLVRVPRLRTLVRRAVIARVSRGARLGARLELITYARAPGDRMPLTDRWVDQTVVGRRARRTPIGLGAAAATGSRFGVCVVGAGRYPSALP